MGKIIATENAPKALGPYSQAVMEDGWLWVSMQVPLDPATGTLVEGEVEVSTRRVLDNIRGIVEAAGGSLSDVVKMTLYLANFKDFARINAVFAEYFPQSPPARAALQAAALPLGALLALDAVAKVK